MELRYLRYFLAVAETRNMSRAATQARVAQPALSRQIRDLEHELGVALLDRHSKGVSLTLAGEAFARGAEATLREIGAALDRSQATSDGRRGRVVLATIRAAMLRGLPAELEEVLRREHPEISLVVQDLDPPDVWEALRDGGADIALGAGLDSSTLVIEPLWEELLDRAIVPANHPLAARRTVSIPDLGELPFVLAQRIAPAHVLEPIFAALEASGFRSPLLVIDAGLRASHFAVSAGRGWTLVSRSRALAPPQGTVVVEVENFPLPMQMIAVWRGDERRPVVRTILETMFAIVRGYPEARVRPEPALPPVGVARAHRRRVTGTVPPTLESRHLRALLGVAAAQTIGRAAERLGVTQPALSRQLKELEHLTGTPLLKRGARGVLLTAAGASLAGECPEMLLHLERLVQETTRARRGMEGRCVIGAVATVATSELLTRTLTACAATHPDIHIAIEEVSTPAQPNAIAQGDIDLGLAHAYPALTNEDEFIQERVMEDRLEAALLSTTHPLAGWSTLGPADLADVPLLFMARPFHPAFHDRVMSALAAIGLEPRIDATYEGLQTVWALTAQGKGWCLGFRSHRTRPPSGTVAVPIEGFGIPWGIDLLRRRKELSPAVRSVAETIKAVSRELFRGAPRATSPEVNAPAKIAR